MNAPWLFSILWCAGTSSVTTNACHVLQGMERPLWLLVRSPEWSGMVCVWGGGAHCCWEELEGDRRQEKGSRRKEAAEWTFRQESILPRLLKAGPRQTAQGTLTRLLLVAGQKWGAQVGLWSHPEMLLWFQSWPRSTRCSSLLLLPPRASTSNLLCRSKATTGQVLPQLLCH